MWSSPLFWIALAVALFWALGAYNRLMRLRSAVLQAFGSFDAHMVRRVAFLSEFSVAVHGRGHAFQPGSESPAMTALQGATTQLGASLAVARARPQDVDAVAALEAAREVLWACWQAAILSAQSPAPNALDRFPRGGQTQSARESDTETDAIHAVETTMTMVSLWQARWDAQALQTDQAAHVYGDAVAQYNAAISQFPASVLARVFGVKGALGLRAETEDSR